MKPANAILDLLQEKQAKHLCHWRWGCLYIVICIALLNNGYPHGQAQEAESATAATHKPRTKPLVDLVLPSKHAPDPSPLKSYWQGVWRGGGRRAFKMDVCVRWGCVRLRGVFVDMHECSKHMNKITSVQVPSSPLTVKISKTFASSVLSPSSKPHYSPSLTLGIFL